LIDVADLFERLNEIIDKHRAVQWLIFPVVLFFALIYCVWSRLYIVWMELHGWEYDWGYGVFRRPIDRDRYVTTE